MIGYFCLEVLEFFNPIQVAFLIIGGWLRIDQCMLGGLI